MKNILLYSYKVLVFVFLLYTLTSYAQISMTATGGYSQNFDTLPSSGSVNWADNSTLTSWFAQRSGMGTEITADWGSSSAGNLYSYGSKSQTDRGSNDPDTPNYSYDITATVSQPIITTDKNSLSGFTYAFLQGPAATQSFVVNGSSLGGDITLTTSPDWEISTNLTYDGSNTSPWSSIVLPRSALGAVTNKTIHVRLKDNLPIETYNGTITLTSPGAVTTTVSLAGRVTVGIVEMKVTGNAVSVANGSTEPFALNNTLFASQNLGNSQTKIFEIKNLGGAPLSIGTITISGTDAGSFSILNGPAVGTVLTQNQTAGFQIRFAPTTIGTKNATVSISNNDSLRNPYTFAIKGGAVYCSSAGEIIVAQQDFESIPAAPALIYSISNFGAISPGPLTGFSYGSSGNSSMPKDNHLYASAVRGYRIQGADSTGEKTSGVLLTFENVDTSSYTNISLSFKVAGFSLGSTTNGMDNLDASNSATIIHGDKLDYILVEISPDGGATWYPQAKVVSGALNLPWGFNSKYTVSGNRNYAADNSLTYFNSTDAARYSSISIEKLPAVTNLKVRISAQDNALNESWILDDVQIKSTGLVPKVWDGTAWIPSPPTKSDKAIINADYNSETWGGFNVCQCEIMPGATLNIATTSEVKVSDFLINNGNIILASEGNLLQVNETDTNSGTGIMRAEQKITLSTARQQYNFLISPVEGFNMKDLYKKSLDINSNPVSAPFVLYYNEATNTFITSSGAYIKGRGLAVKEPALTFLPGEIISVFEGKPVNGAFSYNLINSNPANAKRGLNLIGNPYPSNMDLVKFYQNNATSGNLSPTFYLWDNTANARTSQEGDEYKGFAYAQFNAATPIGEGTPTKAPGEVGTTTLKVPTRYVSVAQGFLARALNSSTASIIFSNSTRSGSPAQDFFGKTSLDKTESDIDRYWLNLINSQNIASNIAVVYSEGGSDDFTKEDSPSLGDSDIIYSLVDDEKVSINGKGNFTSTDVITLGTNHFAGGNYTIALDRTDGIFGKGQPIFLKDKSLGILTDLTKGHYVFAAEAGESTGRFEIVYKPETVLGTDDESLQEIQVYRAAGDFVVSSNSGKITDLEVYEASGRLVYKVRPNSIKTIIPADKLTPGMYILKVDQNGKITGKKILK